jgi:drug/metabolite transporter (DMT)-like permease
MHNMFNSWLAFPHLGETLSVVSALIWAFAIILFRVAGKNVHALGMNLFKNVLAVALFSLTMVIYGEPFLPRISANHYVLFFLSGILGIAVADTLLFIALNKLGAELTAIVDCAYSPSVIGLSFLFLGERMNPLQTFGVVLIVLAMFLITQRRSDTHIPRQTLLAGIGAGILSQLFSAAGIVMMKPMLPGTSLFWASLVRMTGGTVGVGLFIAFHPRRRAFVAPLMSLKNAKILAPASFLATYLSLVIWMGGMKYTQASIAAALNQMGAIFIFILAAIFLKEKITLLKLTAVIIAFAGAILVSFPF